jgi:Na+/H+-dicarboxylate symporter
MMSLTNQILLSLLLGLVVGVGISLGLSDVQWVQQYVVMGVFAVVGSLFLMLLKMLVVPLVFFSLTSGVVGLKDLSALGRTGGKAFAMFLLTTTLAISSGLLLANLVGIGQSDSISLESSASVEVQEAPPFTQVLMDIVPENILAALADGNMLQVIFICLFFGTALLHSGAPGQKIAGGIEQLNHVMMSAVELVMKLAPVGVFCLIAKTLATQGFELLLPLAGYIAVTIAVLLLHGWVVIPSLVSFFGLSPWTFLKKIRPAQVFAFSTASSNATIPVTLECVEEDMGVKNSVASFVVPLGATINMDGTAIMQGIATVFVANLYGLDLGMADYATVVGMSVLASIGTAGVPGVGLIMLAMVFQQVGLPVDGIALILGIDRILDMVRTAVNVTGDAAITCMVARTENGVDMKKFSTEATD